MTLNGTWPRSHPLCWVIVFIGYLPLISGLCFEAFYSFRIRALNMDNFSVNISVALLVYKCFLLRKHSGKLSLIIDSMETAWRDLQDSVDVQIMYRHARWSRIFLLVYIALLLVSWIFAVRLAITSSALEPNETRSLRRREFPTPSRYPFDDQSSPNYECIFVYESFVSSSMTIANIAVDTFFVTLVFHLSGQFEVLELRLGNITVENSGTRTEWKSQLGWIVERHLHLIRMTSLVEDSYSFIVLGQLLTTSFNVCLTGYAVMVGIENVNYTAVVRFLLFVFGMLQQMFMYCFAGEYLTNQAQGIEIAAYESEWYTLPSYVGKALLTIMSHAAKPIFITAGNFFPMSLETFKKIMQTSATYWSVLLAVNDD